MGKTTKAALTAREAAALKAAATLSQLNADRQARDKRIADGFTGVFLAQARITEAEQARDAAIKAVTDVTRAVASDFGRDFHVLLTEGLTAAEIGQQVGVSAADVRKLAKNHTDNAAKASAGQPPAGASADGEGDAVASPGTALGADDASAGPTGVAGHPAA
ncbi:hypothetical protein D1871_04520 [Nakamurella silvestris]|nr:hypothetical protein D1871_04520 [Nakamurella silvestris]